MTVSALTADCEQLADGPLMLAAVKGDESAFHLLVDRYLQRIYRFLVRMVGYTWAEDLTQEVFLRAFERRATYRQDSGSFSSWIYGIARNLAIDFLRRKRPVVSMETGRDPDEPPVQLADPRSPEPVSRIQSDETHALVEQAIGALQEPYRTTFVLCVIEGFSYEEAAHVEGCPVKTISSRLARGRAQLRQKMAIYMEQGCTEKTEP